jgi:ectoine hydroxylase-related dioxygenase (phytanoyl-CoA dioxygenase family)
VTFSESNQDVLPSERDIEFYQQHGYWFSPVILPSHVLEAAERGMRRFYAHDWDAEPTDRDGKALPGWKPADGEGVLRKNDYSSLFVNDILALAKNGIIAACAARLIGVNELRLWHDQLIYKPVDVPGQDTNIGWHVDRQYWLNCTSEDMLTAWVPLHNLSVQHGPVRFVDGSHRWRSDGADYFHIDAMGFFNQDLNIEQWWDQSVPAVLRRGQVSFHNCKTIHGSGPNTAGEPRRVITIHLQPGDNRYTQGKQPDGSLAYHLVDGYCRLIDGVPDYTDPEWFPIVLPSR